MRAIFVVLLALVAFNVADAQELSSMKKVTTLLVELMDKVKKEGEQEALTYDNFACFCKRLQDAKRGEITELAQSKDGISASINSEMTQRGVADQGIIDKNSDIARTQAEKVVVQGNQHEDSLKHDAESLDLVQAITNIDSAIQILKATRTANSLSLAQVTPVAQTVQKALLLAEAMGVQASGATKNGKKVVTALLSINEDPAEDLTDLDYSFHSDDVIATLENLKREFSTKKYEVDNTWLEVYGAYQKLILDKDQLVRADQKALDQHSSNKASLTKRISTDEYDYSVTAAELAEDVKYLEDLTKKCSEKAILWDQRVQLRTNELNALQSALETVQMLREPGQIAAKAEFVQKKAVSFLQIPVEKHVQSVKSGVSTKKLELSPRARVLSLLKTSAGKLHSVTLLKAATRAAVDPFAKVKDLLQQLMDGLSKQSEEETSHEQWCKSETDGATKERDELASNIGKVNSELEESEAKSADLAGEISGLEEEIAGTNTNYGDEESMRRKEEAENAESLREARDGRDAVQAAMDLIRKFYSNASAASVDFEKYKVANNASSFIQLTASQQPATTTALPAGTQNIVDLDKFRDVPETGFDDVYVGAQQEGTGILNMLGVLYHDFEKVVHDIQYEEESGSLEFEELEKKTSAILRVLREALAGRNKEKFELDEQDDANRKRLEEYQEGLNKVLKEMGELEKACSDSRGMTVEDRMKRRQEEVEALEKALCILSARESNQIEAC